MGWGAWVEEPLRATLQAVEPSHGDATATPRTEERERRQLEAKQRQSLKVFLEKNGFDQDVKLGGKGYGYGASG